jgi:hypothetical protein
MGACVDEINQAAQTTDPGVVFGALSDPQHAITLARDLGDCAFLNCAAECGF